MDREALIIGAIGIIWGVILFFMRPQLMEFSREGGRGLRDARVINVLVIAAVALLGAGGIALILTGLV